MLACDNNGSTYFYIQNHRGDVIALINTNGDAEAIRDYDASGQIITQAPRDRDPFGFTGGLDVGNGLWKLGARFYDSGKGSFIQQDRYMGDPSDPLSLNRYVYCGLDPINFVDPTGFNAAAIAQAGYSFAGILGCIPGGQLAAVVVAGVVTGAVAAVLVHDYMMKSASVGDLWQDKMKNPGDWELVKERTEAGKQKGTTSYERKYVNKVTGEVVYEHEIKNDSNQKSTHGPHPRGYQKGDDSGSDGGSE